MRSCVRVCTYCSRVTDSVANCRNVPHRGAMRPSSAWHGVETSASRPGRLREPSFFGSTPPLGRACACLDVCTSACQHVFSSTSSTSGCKWTAVLATASCATHTMSLMLDRDLADAIHMTLDSATPYPVPHPSQTVSLSLALSRSYSPSPSPSHTVSRFFLPSLARSLPLPPSSPTWLWGSN